MSDIDRVIVAMGELRGLATSLPAVREELLATLGLLDDVTEECQALLAGLIEIRSQVALIRQEKDRIKNARA